MADQQQNRVPSSTFVELGTRGLNRWGQDIFEEFLPTLRWPHAGKIYKEMSHNDPVITAILLTSRQLIKRVTWRVIPASDSRADQEAAEFLRSCMDDMSMTWTDLIDEITSYFEYGWSYHEIVYKRRLGDNRDPSKRSKYNDGRIGWRKIPSRSQDSWAGWEFDEEDDGSVIGMWQDTGNGKVLIPIEKALLFRTTSARGNPEGRSFLRGAYRPWYFKKHIEEIEGIGIERDLAGLPILIPPENLDIWNLEDPNAQKIRQQAESLVRNIRRDRNEGVVLPYGWTLELLSAKSNRQFDTNAIINRYDQRIAITLLSDIVMLGADKVGSFALAEVKKSLLAVALDAQVQSIAEIFNRYAIPRLFKLNVFPGITDYPKLEASQVDAPDLKTLAEYIQKLAGAKMPLFPNIDLENYLRRIANLPETTEDDPARNEYYLVTRKTDNNNNQNISSNEDDSSEGGE